MSREHEENWARSRTGSATAHDADTPAWTGREAPLRRPEQPVTSGLVQRRGDTPASVGPSGLAGGASPAAAQQLQAATVQRMVGGHAEASSSEPDTSAPADRVEIPALLHFIWMGKPPTDAAVRNILTWAARAKNTSWRILLWTDDAIQTGKWAPQLATLRGSVEVRQIRPIIDPRLRQHYEAAVGKAPRAFNVASDLARYSILHQLGGVYADVDLGPGDVDLTRVPKLSTADIPVTAPQVRDRQSLEEQLDPEQLKLLSTQEAAQSAAQRAYRKNQLNNNLLISGPQSTFMNRLIDNVDQRVGAREDERDEWSDIAAVMTGPQPLIRTMHQHLGGVSERRLIDSMDRDTLGHWSRLDWLTEESENQSYDAAPGGTSQGGWLAGWRNRR